MAVPHGGVLVWVFFKGVLLFSLPVFFSPNKGPFVISFLALPPTVFWGRRLPLPEFIGRSRGVVPLEFGGCGLTFWPGPSPVNRPGFPQVLPFWGTGQSRPARGSGALSARHFYILFLMIDFQKRFFFPGHGSWVPWSGEPWDGSSTGELFQLRVVSTASRCSPSLVSSPLGIRVSPSGEPCCRPQSDIFFPAPHLLATCPAAKSTPIKTRSCFPPPYDRRLIPFRFPTRFGLSPKFHNLCWAPPRFFLLRGLVWFWGGGVPSFPPATNEILRRIHPFPINTLVSGSFSETPGCSSSSHRPPRSAGKPAGFCLPGLSRFNPFLICYGFLFSFSPSSPQYRRGCFGLGDLRPLPRGHG